jgi:glycosyltransferase involved in cell wall biosynthesis
MDFSIIIPALNESKKIAADIHLAADFLASQNFIGQVIIVDDGSTDSTAEIAQKVHVPQNVQLTVIRDDVHKGKGAAVRAGILASKADYVMFADSGGCVPFNNAIKGLELIKNGQCDIACGSRRMTISDIVVDQPFYRKLSSLAFRTFTRIFLKLPPDFTDTQCGFKIFRGNVAKKLFKISTIDGFLFDLEIILLALKQNYSVREFAVEWSCDLDSRLSVSRSFMSVLNELITIKKNLAHHKNDNS